MSQLYFGDLKKGKIIPTSPFKSTPTGNENAVWFEPKLVCTVQWMPRKNEGMNQPIFKGMRDDKTAKECVIK